jgi:LIM domain kinase 1
MSPSTLRENGAFSSPYLSLTVHLIFDMDPLRESRHPNVVLYLGLSRAPDPDGRIFIISEFIENGMRSRVSLFIYLLLPSGNLRQYIHDKSKPLPWRLRLSFATDIARALAYLHARKCIHRDLKGENLLLTANGRLKITDFGFARIAARTQEESRRLTFCGTDAYMSPEILLGYEFDLPTDIFSMGVILAEIAARRLADDTHFARSAPSFTIDTDEVRSLANSGCPPEFIQLAIDCISGEPSTRPTTRVILDRLRIIEAEVLARPDETEVHTGSIKFMTGHRRHHAAPRIPSFGEGIGKGIRSSSTQEPQLSEEESDDELSDAVTRLESVTIIENGVPVTIEVTWCASCPHVVKLQLTKYQTTVRATLSNLFSHRKVHTPTTAQASFVDIVNSQPTRPSLLSPLSSQSAPPQSHPILPPNRPTPRRARARSRSDSASFHNLHSILLHRLGRGRDLLYRRGDRRRLVPRAGARTPLHARQARHDIHEALSARVAFGRVVATGGWSALDFFFASGLLPGGGGGAKCDICVKRLGRKAALECDDCGLRAHIKCGEVAPRDCALPCVVVDPHACLLGPATRRRSTQAQ